MNTESIDCHRVDFAAPPFKGITKPGDFCFSPDYKFIYIWIPGVSGPDALEIALGNPTGPRVWGWDGNKETPTLTPSIHAPDQWHGWLKSGRLVSC
jgi:hypothetical protein